MPVAPRPPVEDVAPAFGIDRRARLGRAVEVPSEDFAFVTETAIADVIQPQALNGGNLVDIYQRREEDFMAKSTIEVWYYDPDGAQVRETMFVMDPNPRQAPRVCATVEAVRGMHRAIAVLTRKVDNLNMTLRSCREHYYKELSLLRHNPDACRQDVYYFSPTKYEDTVTKELVEDLIRKKVEVLDQALEEKDKEIEELKQRVTSVQSEEKSDISKLRKSLATLPLDQLFHILRTQNASREAAFFDHVERLLRERGGRHSNTPSRRPVSAESATHDTNQPVRLSVEAEVDDGAATASMGRPISRSSATEIASCPPRPSSWAPASPRGRLEDAERRVSDLQVELEAEKGWRRALEAQIQGNPEAEDSDRRRSQGPGGDGHAQERAPRESFGCESISEEPSGDPRRLEQLLSSKTVEAQGLAAENASLLSRVAVLQEEVARLLQAAEQGADAAAGRRRGASSSSSGRRSRKQSTSRSRSGTRSLGASAAPAASIRSASEKASTAEALISAAPGPEALISEAMAVAAGRPDDTDDRPHAEPPEGTVPAEGSRSASASSRSAAGRMRGSDARRTPTPVAQIPDPGPEVLPFDEMDIDGDGAITREEFEEIMAHQRGSMSSSVVRRQSSMPSSVRRGSKSSSIARRPSSKGRSSMAASEPPAPAEAPQTAVLVTAPEPEASQPAAAAPARGAPVQVHAEAPPVAVRADGDAAEERAGSQRGLDGSEPGVLPSTPLSVMASETIAFEEIDVDGDGVITRGEWDTAMAARMAAAPSSRGPSPAPELEPELDHWPTAGSRESVRLSRTLALSDGREVAPLPGRPRISVVDSTEVCACQTTFAEGALFCWRCGRQRPGTKLAQQCNCGHDFVANEGFCGRCGQCRPFEQVEPEAEEAEAEEEEAEEDAEREDDEGAKERLRAFLQGLPGRLVGTGQQPEKSAPLKPPVDDDTGAAVVVAAARAPSPPPFQVEEIRALRAAAATRIQAAHRGRAARASLASKEGVPSGGVGPGGRSPADGRAPQASGDLSPAQHDELTERLRELEQQSEDGGAPAEQPAAGERGAPGLEADRAPSEDGGARGEPGAGPPDGSAEQPAAGVGESARTLTEADAYTLAEADGDQQEAAVAAAGAGEEHEPPGGAGTTIVAEPVPEASCEGALAIQGALAGEEGASQSMPVYSVKSMPPTTAGSASAPSLLGTTWPGTVDTRPGTHVDAMAFWRKGEWKVMQDVQAKKEDMGVQTWIGFDQPLQGWAVQEVDADPPAGARMVEATRRELLQWCLRYIEHADPSLLVKMTEPHRAVEAAGVVEKTTSVQKRRTKTEQRALQGQELLGSTDLPAAGTDSLRAPGGALPAKKPPVLRKKLTKGVMTAVASDLFGAPTDKPSASLGGAQAKDPPRPPASSPGDQRPRALRQAQYASAKAKEEGSVGVVLPPAPEKRKDPDTSVRTAAAQRDEVREPPAQASEPPLAAGAGGKFTPFEGLAAAAAAAPSGPAPAARSSGGSEPAPLEASPSELPTPAPATSTDVEDAGDVTLRTTTIDAGSVALPGDTSTSSSHAPQRPAPRGLLQAGPSPRQTRRSNAGSVAEPGGSSAVLSTAPHESVDEVPASLDANLAALANLTRCSNPGRNIVAPRTSSPNRSTRSSGHPRGSTAADFDRDRDSAEPLSARRAQAGSSLPEPTPSMRFGSLAQGSWNPTTATGGLSSRNAATYMQGVEELLRADSDTEARSRSATRSPSPPRSPGRDSPQRTGSTTLSVARGARLPEAPPPGGVPRTQRPLDQLPLLRPSR